MEKEQLQSEINDAERYLKAMEVAHDTYETHYVATKRVLTDRIALLKENLKK